MTLGLNSFSYHLAFGKHSDRRRDGPMTLAKFLNRARNIGYSTVQIDPLHFNPERDKPRWVKRMADNLGMKLVAGGISIEEDAIRADLDLCAEWESPILREYLGHMYSPRRDRKGDPVEAAVKKLEKVIPLAEKAGVVIAIENHGELPTADQIRMFEMLDSPYVRACLDTGNSMMILEEPKYTVERLAPWSVMAHLKDLQATPTTYGAKMVGVALGTGSIDLDAVIPMLLDAPDLEYIILETTMEAVGTDTEMLAREDRAAVDSLAYWNEWMARNRP